ncbi:pyridoxal kinase [Vandammella animalimorsus]|uniref:pyridoxal kinase n=1 Tax=Vandammella animalimorsus TaxID=2029117 RepID=A0A2A2T6E0_9BURK|nr:pyridoxal kinase PdxY [Vandammella animalimorsus]PAT30894.1 pyridoxal kinase [Vandammella animalimorsus]PAX16775.1 pyridoxal kinase [Vandammella animalimorsus]PAX20427.1 pyridoxal kinase [Vandammella animalimorsus]
MSAPLVLSVQSHVAYGHAGNSAAVFAMQRLGIEVLPVHTVQFSNHTGYGAFRGQVFDVAHLREVFQGIEERGLLPKISAVLSGYMGDSSIGDAIIDIAQRVRQANPAALYLCDPVFGDVGRGVFVRPGIAEYHRDHTLAAADIITPNQFEFEQLMGVTLQSTAHAVEVARRHIAGTGKTVVITSLLTPEIAQKGQLATLAVRAQQAWAVHTPIIARTPLPNGMGDAFSAILLAHLLQQRPLPEALQQATASLYALVGHTQDGQRDLPLIEQQAQIVQPQQPFEVVAL